MHIKNTGSPSSVLVAIPFWKPKDVQGLRVGLPIVNAQYKDWFWEE